MTGKGHLCYCCRARFVPDRGTCAECRQVLRQIQEAHHMVADQHEYEATEPARREERMRARGRVGT